MTVVRFSDDSTDASNAGVSDAVAAKNKASDRFALCNICCLR